jgi:hypothetical protein
VYVGLGIIGGFVAAGGFLGQYFATEESAKNTDRQGNPVESKTRTDLWQNAVLGVGCGVVALGGIVTFIVLGNSDSPPLSVTPFQSEVADADDRPEDAGAERCSLDPRRDVPARRPFGTLRHHDPGPRT